MCVFAGTLSSSRRCNMWALLFYFHSCFCIFLVGKIITLINNLWFQFVNQLGWICRSECKQCVPFWVHQNQFNLIKCDYSNIYHKRLLYVTHFTSSLHREKKLETFSAFIISFLRNRNKLNNIDRNSNKYIVRDRIIS